MQFQFNAGPNQGTTETDVLQANSQPGAAAPWQYAAGTTTIYALGTAAGPCVGVTGARPAHGWPPGGQGEVVWRRGYARRRHEGDG